MHRVEIAEAAAEELDEAYRWYEGQRKGLGDELLGEFLQSIQSAAEKPLRYPVVEGSLRRALLHRFPYGVCYRLEAGGIVVVAFFHGKRNPRHWKKRS